GGAGGAAGAAGPPARYRSRGRALRPGAAPVAREAVAPAARGVAGPVGHPGGPHRGGGALLGGGAAGPVWTRLPYGFDADRLRGGGRRAGEECCPRRGTVACW